MPSSGPVNPGGGPAFRIVAVRHRCGGGAWGGNGMAAPGSGRRRPVDRNRARRRRVLYTRAKATPEQTLVIRACVVLGLLALVLAAFWFDQEGLEDKDGHLTFVDLIYFTMVTVTTVGYGDIVPVSPTARLIDAFLVTPIRTIIWFIFLGTTYEFVVQGIIEEFRMKRFQAQLRDHVVICGYGRSGQIAAREIVANGRPPEGIVVIDLQEDRIRLAADEGHIGLRGDTTSDDMVKLAAVDRADAVVISTGRDDTTILTVLTVRNLAPDARIVASIKEEENIKLARQGGANAIVSPPKLGGYLMADAVDARYKSEFLCDIMTASGELELKERPVAPDEVGRSPAELRGGVVVQVTRDSRPVPPESWHDLRLRAGDTLLLVVGTT
jgi:voltage-gated potassium channel